MSFYKVTGGYCNFIFERCIGSSKSVRRNLYAVVLIFTKKRRRKDAIEMDWSYRRKKDIVGGGGY